MGDGLLRSGPFEGTRNGSSSTGTGKYRPSNRPWTGLLQLGCAAGCQAVGALGRDQLVKAHLKLERGGDQI
jgi:hypothetical protein